MVEDIQPEKVVEHIVLNQALHCIAGWTGEGVVRTNHLYKLEQVWYVPDYQVATINSLPPEVCCQKDGQEGSDCEPCCSAHERGLILVHLT